MDMANVDVARCERVEKEVIEGVCLSYDMIKGICLETMEKCAALQEEDI